MSVVYGDHDVQRRCPEAPKSLLRPTDVDCDARHPFGHDRARILHCGALRRLADKTQVVGPRQGDVPRTRLTHSLEVAQIASGLAAGLGANEELAELAGLAHDIGHPPYGHNGEHALNQLAQTCGGFEGNAQTFRILTRLETKMLTPQGDSAGLNLTRASLDAVAKYPWPRSEGITKYGAYADDVPVLEWVRQGAPDGRRCVEAQIMDWADDIAYSVHDVEDAILSGRIDLRALADAQEVAALAEDASTTFGLCYSDVEAAAERLWALPLLREVADSCVTHLSPSLPRCYLPTRQHLVALKALTSDLVGRFVTATITLTREHHEGALGRYHGQLHIPHDCAAEVGLLKTLAVRYVMHDEELLRRQEKERHRIHRVAEWLKLSNGSGLDPLFAHDWMTAERQGDEAACERIIIDQIASYTESRLERLCQAVDS